MSETAKMENGGRGAGLAGSLGSALLPIVVVAAILAVLPPLWFGDSPYTTSLAVKALVFASYGIGFNLIFGCTNQLFLCVGALAGIGGYSTAIIADRSSLPIALAIAAGTVGAAVIGGLLSWIAVRRSLGIIFTGIVTLVFSLAFANFLIGKRDLTGSETGLFVTGAPSSLGDEHVGAYYLFAGVVVGFLVVFRALQLSHFGWAFRGLRDDELAAELIGLAGGLYAFSSGYISPDTYAFQHIDVRVLVLVAFGGLGTLLGPVIGAGAFAIVDEQLTASLQLREVLYGVVVIVIFLFFRRGLVVTATELARRVRGKRRGDVSAV
jgi:branched-chain amino acid transport system permease protein